MCENQLIYIYNYYISQSVFHGQTDWNAVNQRSASDDDVYSPTTLWRSRATRSPDGSDANYTITFIIHKPDIEINHQHLYTNDPNTTDKYPELNQPFSFHELHSAIHQSKKHTSPGEDRISYEILQHLPNKCLKILLKLYNQVCFLPHGSIQ